VSNLVAITFTSVAFDRHATRATLAAHLRTAVSLANASGLRIHADALGPRTAAISFAAAPGRAGCAAVRFGRAAAVRVAYAPTRGGACAASDRVLQAPPGAGR
jgi:hypothetical protein